MGFFDSLFKKDKIKKTNNAKVEQNAAATREEKQIINKPDIALNKEIISEPNKEKQTITKPKKEIQFNVAGITFKGIQGNLKTMFNDEKEVIDPYEGFSNKEILEMYSEDDKIYEVDIWGSSEMQLIPEPENKFDPNAIKVVHQVIGDVGHVPAVDCKRVKKILQGDYSIEWRLIGGKYKHIEYDDDKFKDVVKIENNTYGIIIILTES